MSLRGHATSAICIALCFEAGGAKNRAATLFHWTWLEGNLALRTAFRADGIVHLAVAKAL
jgi:hypothetical protein